MEDFNSLGDNKEVVGVEATAAVDSKKADKKARMRKMAEILKETLSTDTSFAQRMRTLSDSVSVVNTLGYGDSGNIVVDPNSTSKQGKDRKLVSTSQIVGYRVANIGTTPIQYVTEEYAPNEAGVWEGKQVTKVLEPNATADFTRKFMTIFCSQPEISFQLVNGKIIRGSSAVKGGDIDAELEAHYFLFNDKSIKVNSDETKMNVAKKAKQPDGSSKWVVKPEFEATFGYLNNAKTSSKKSRGTKNGPDYNPQDMAANYIQHLLKERGKM